MRSLSLKIFLWFWSAALVGSLAFIAVAVWWPSQTFVGRAAQYFGFNLATTGRLAIDLHDQEGPEAMAKFLGQIETLSAFNLYIVDREGTSLRSRPLPEVVQTVSQRAFSEGSVQAQGWTTHPVFAHPMESRDGQPYVIVLELPAGLVNLLSQMSHAIALRFTAALLASGVVCFLMVRYLTTPIRKLQSAVRKFAQGDLSVRVAPTMGSRKDEIADLGRDFDIMAARIETLMHAHEHLLRDVAHELRSPLTRLNVALEIARKHGDEKMLGYLDRISTEGQKLSGLVTQVLTLSRLENVNVERHLEPCSLESIIHRIVRDANFEGQTDSEGSTDVGGKTMGAAVEFNLEQRTMLMADERLIHSAIENIVRNALRFSPNSTPVKITQKRVEHDDKTLAVVLVSDRGPGVPPEALEDLFRPFFRVNEKQGRASGGAGIGLAIAYHAVTLHGGRIQATNRANGGLTVEISLPVEKAEVV